MIKKIKRFFDNRFNIIDIIIILNPIIDLMTTLSIVVLSLSITFGIVIRSLILLFLFIYQIIKGKISKTVMSYFFFLAFYTIIFFQIVFNDSSMINVLLELKGYIKIFYFPIMFLIFINLYPREKVDRSLQTSIFSSVFIYWIFIIIPILFGLSFLTYSLNNMGFCGWFYSPNETGAILAITNPIIIYYLMNQKNKIFKTFFLIVDVYVISVFGTKTTILGLAITLLIFIFVCLIRYFIEKNKVFIMKSFSLIMLSIIFIITFLYVSPIKSNIAYQKNLITKYSSEISDTGGVVNTGEADDNKQEADDNKQEAKRITEFIVNNKYVTRIFSSRNIYAVNGYKLWKSYPVKNQIFGTGMYSNGIQKTVEIDGLDILFSYGIIGFILFFIPIIIVLLKIIFNLVKNKINILKEEYFTPLIVSVFLGFSISIFAGHILIAPGVSIFLAIILSSLYNETKKPKK